MPCIPMAHCLVVMSIQARMSSFVGQYMTCIQAKVTKEVYGNLAQTCTCMKKEYRFNNHEPFDFGFAPTTLIVE